MKKLFFLLWAIALNLSVDAQNWLYPKTTVTTTTSSVGIGTTVLSAKLNVSIGVDNTIFNEKALEVAKGNRRIFFVPKIDGYNFLTHASDMGIFWNDGLGPVGSGKNGTAGLVIAPHASSSAGIRISADGVVSIGAPNVSAGYLLGVRGKVICEELKVSLYGVWPDYVFDKKYKLLTLDSLENYIQVNKHLPNIPAAAEVEKNGISLGEMQVKQMEKIEELSLYIIELNKQLAAVDISAINKKLQELEAKNTALQNQMQALQNK